ncbi:MAG: hypothetical protein FWC97_10150, partial [Treponema sp.]|nr:hypothetical protein [Treponema sp.]
ILRMYYILSMIDEGYITNIEFKKRLLRIQINKMANNSVQEDLLLSIVGTVNDIYNLLAEKMNNTNEVFSMDNFRELDHRRFTNRALQEQMFERFLVNRVYFLTSILPYLKYNQ